MIPSALIASATNPIKSTEKIGCIWTRVKAKLSSAFRYVSGTEEKLDSDGLFLLIILNYFTKTLIRNS